MQPQSKFEIKLHEDMKTLKECQVNQKVTSCTQCEKLIGCEIRIKYVQSVYTSMNKGKGGGFEF